MRICLLSDGYPSEGIQYFVFVEQLVNALVDMGIDVDVITPQSITKNLMRRQSFLPEVNIHKTSRGKEYKVYRPKFISVGNNRFLSPIARVTNASAVKRSVRKIGVENINVFYGHFWHNAYELSKYAEKCKKPLFVACGEGDNALENLVASMSPEKLKWFNEVMTGVISVSSENKRKCIHLGLAEEKDIEVFPNCVDQDIFHQLDRQKCRAKLGLSDSDFAVIFVGGFIHRKGSTRLSQALTELNDKQIKAIFIGCPVGGDAAVPEYENIVSQGQVSHDKLPEYLSAADVFVLPTLKEGCCNAIVEAVSCGLPVISSNGAFNDDILDEKCSIRIDPMSVVEIKEAILKIKNDPQLRNSMAKAASEKSKDWSIVSRAQNILRFINNQIVEN